MNCKNRDSIFVPFRFELKLSISMKTIQRTFILCMLFALFNCGYLAAQSSPAFKQQFRYTKKTNAKLEALQGTIPDIPVADASVITPSGPVIGFREDTPFSVPLGSSYNVYSVISETPNAVSYHPDINSIVFCHRQNYQHPGGSGIISFDVSTDGGATWDTTTKQVTPSLETVGGMTINGNRYPNGCIYNPPGNTDPSNAFFIGTGASLWDDPVYGSNWGWEFLASSKFDGSLVDEAYYTTADSNIYLSTGMEYTPDAVWYSNLRREQNAAFQLFSPVVVAKMEFNSGTNSFDRTATELALDYSSGVDSFAVNPRIAFGPDGQTGYAVISGVDADDDEIYPSVKPVVWKTTDGGNTWVKQPRMHYQPMDSLIAYTIPIDGDGDGASDDPAGDSPRVPYLSQFDITVDANGDLHLVGSMLSSSDTASTAADFGFIWTGATATEIFHFISDGENWESYRVSDWYNEDGDLGAETVDERLQASRTPGGEYVFFTFSKSYYSVIEEDGEYPNISPDIYGYAYRLSDGYVVDPKNFGWAPGTVFEDFDFTDVGTIGFLHMTSPVSILDGEFWNQELPIVYGVPRDVNDDLQPIDYYFLRSAGFDDAEYHERGGMVNTEEIASLSVFEVSPNPSNGFVNVRFDIEEGTKYQLQLVNAMGQHVSVLENGRAFTGTQNLGFDVSSLSAGLYIIQLQTESGTHSHKLVVR